MVASMTALAPLTTAIAAFVLIDLGWDPRLPRIADVRWLHPHLQMWYVNGNGGIGPCGPAVRISPTAFANQSVTGTPSAKIRI